MEFEAENECPWCGEEFLDTINFNEDEADMGGIDSGPRKTTCSECDKDFWYEARLDFEVNVTNVFKGVVKR